MIENKINRIIDTIICIKSKENKFLNQDLKNQDVEVKEFDNIAKGAIKIKILIKIYLNEYEKTKPKRDVEIKPFINPSNVKISIEDVSIEIFELIFKINSEKQIFLLNKFSPKSLIAKEILENISKNWPNKKYEKFIQIPQIINLIKKLWGCSIWEYVIWDNKYLIAKYIIIPNKRELAINKIPFVVEVPKIFSKFLSFKIFELIKVISSNIVYKLLSMELNKFPKIVFIVSIIICVIFELSNFPPFNNNYF